MNTKRILALVLAAVLLLTVPAAAMALTTTSSTSNYSSGSKANARDYVIKFGKEHNLGERDHWKVYSAPSLNAVRGANGKASATSQDDVYSAGWNGAWLLVRYVKDNGGYRVGWIPKTALNMRTIQATRSVNFAYWTVTVGQNCTLTDDPLMESEALAYATKGEKLTYLGYYQYGSGKEYAYVQGEMTDGQPVCGFIPFDAIAW